MALGCIAEGFRPGAEFPSVHRSFLLDSVSDGGLFFMVLSLLSRIMESVWFESTSIEGYK